MFITAVGSSASASAWLAPTALAAAWAPFVALAMCVNVVCFFSSALIAVVVDTGAVAVVVAVVVDVAVDVVDGDVDVAVDIAVALDVNVDAGVATATAVRVRVLVKHRVQQSTDLHTGQSTVAGNRSCTAAPLASLSFTLLLMLPWRADVDVDVVDGVLLSIVNRFECLGFCALCAM